MTWNILRFRVGLGTPPRLPTTHVALSPSERVFIYTRRAEGVAREKRTLPRHEMADEDEGSNLRRLTRRRILV